MPDADDEVVEDREEALRELKDYIVTAIAEGFDSQEEIAEGALDFISDTDTTESILREDVDELVGQLWTAQLAAQATWAEPTDCDRLERAFGVLELHGVVARQNWTCCQNCGHAEMGDELARARATGIPVNGYTFFHQQDTESAATGGGLMLAYGLGRKGTESDVVQLAWTIVGALEVEGLKVSWDGSVKKRILVHLDWKKRRC
jgi:hypothetical protein